MTKASFLAISLVSFCPAPTLAQSAQSWMSPDVSAAWSQGYRGQGTNIIVVDTFNTSYIQGNLWGAQLVLPHGYWTDYEALLVAPWASVWAKNWSDSPVPLFRGLTTLNLSYGVYTAAANASSNINWSGQEASIIAYARWGAAVVVKAAGNDAVPLNAVNQAGKVDVFNAALTNGVSVIFEGALSSNGSTIKQASMASYSNVAGSDPNVQSKFLVVGVAGNQTGLYGTSFAAPIISGYSAIIGSKFRTATPTQVANRLLSTARQDTVVNYNPAVYGRGEASLSRALAPSKIN